MFAQCGDAQKEMPRMNRTQLIVLWVGIAIVVLLGLFPPGTRGGYEFILEIRSISLGRLIIEWAMVAAITGGLVYTLKVYPDLLLRIACFFLSSIGQLRPHRLNDHPYAKYLDEARNNKHRAAIRWFSIVFLVLLLLALIVIRSSVQPHVLRL